MSRDDRKDQDKGERPGSAPKTDRPEETKEPLGDDQITAIRGGSGISQPYPPQKGSG